MTYKRDCNLDKVIGNRGRSYANYDNACNHVINFPESESRIGKWTDCACATMLNNVNTVEAQTKRRIDEY